MDGIRNIYIAQKEIHWQKDANCKGNLERDIWVDR